MTPRDKALIGGLISIVCVASIPLMFMFGGKTPPPMGAEDATATSVAVEPTAVSPSPATGSGAPIVPLEGGVAPSTADTSARADGSAPARALALTSPREVVETQRQLLEARDDAAFRSTFMPEVQRELTAEAIEACRKRVVGKPLKPDWEVAEHSMERGSDGGAAGIHTVVRVSMFGKSMTGFHEVAPGRWLADAAWCVPIW